MWAFGTIGLKRSVLTACSICFLKTINYIEVQKYLFGINGLNARSLPGPFSFLLVTSSMTRPTRWGHVVDTLWPRYQQAFCFLYRHVYKKKTTNVAYAWRYFNTVYLCLVKILNPITNFEIKIKKGIQFQVTASVHLCALLFIMTVINILIIL